MKWVFLLIMFSSVAHAQNDLEVLLQKVQGINHQQCAPLSLPSATPIASFTPVKSNSTPTLPGTDIEVSVLTEKEVQKYFKKMKLKKDIPFRYPEDGCYARAHQMAMLLEKDGVICGKAFVEGDLQVNSKNTPEGFVRWWYHVAPTVLVKIGSENVPYVIDPSTFDQAVPMSTWTGLQTCGNQKECTNAVYYTNRFAYGPSDRRNLKLSFEKDDQKDMISTLNTYLKVQKERIKKAEKKNAKH